MWQLHDLSGYGNKRILLIYLSFWFLTSSTEFCSHLKEISANVSVPTPWWHLGGRRCFIIRGTWVVNLTPRTNYPLERNPIPIWYETGWDIEHIWTFRRREKSSASACWSVAFEITYNISVLWHFTIICFRWFALIIFVLRSEETFSFPERQHKTYPWICLWCLDIIFLSILKYFQMKFI